MDDDFSSGGDLGDSDISVDTSTDIDMDVSSDSSMDIDTDTSLDSSTDVADDISEDVDLSDDLSGEATVDFPDEISEDTDISDSYENLDDEAFSTDEFDSDELSEISEDTDDLTMDEGIEDYGGDDDYTEIVEDSDSDDLMEYMNDADGQFSDTIAEDESDITDEMNSDDNSNEMSELQEDIDDDPPKVLRRDADDLIETGNRNIDNILDVKADDYRDKGLSEEEISERLEQDRISEQEEFLHDAFPNQSVSTDVFRSDGQSTDNASDDTDSYNDDAASTAEHMADTDEPDTESLTDTDETDAESLTDADELDAESLTDTGELDAESLSDADEPDTESLTDTDEADAESLTDTDEPDAESLTDIDEPDAESLTDTDELSEEGITEEIEQEEELNKVGIMRDVLEQNVDEQKLPSDKRVTWSNPDDKGNGDCLLRDDVEISVHDKSTGEDVKMTGSEFKQHMLEKYQTDHVTYSHREPDFEPFEQPFDEDDFNSFLADKYGESADHRAVGTHEGHVYLEHMDTQRGGDGTFKQANEMIADSLGVSTRDVQDYMKARNLTWHEVGDRHTVRAVPSEINQVFGHTGGIGIQKDIEALSSNVQEAVDHSPISLQRTSDVVHLSNSGDMEKSIEQAHELNQSTKKNMFGKK